MRYPREAQAIPPTLARAVARLLPDPLRLARRQFPLIRPLLSWEALSAVHRPRRGEIIRIRSQSPGNVFTPRLDQDVQEQRSPQVRGGWLRVLPRSRLHRARDPLSAARPRRRRAHLLELHDTPSPPQTAAPIAQWPLPGLRL